MSDVRLDQALPGNATRLFSCAGLALLLLGPMLGCKDSQGPVSRPDETTAAEEEPSTNPEKVDVLAGPFTKNVTYVVKEQKPFILMDLAPELRALKAHGKPAQAEYLLKRALMVAAADNVLRRKEYEGKDVFVVRMILLTELDEYGKPKWGSARELALLEVPRSAVSALSQEQINAMKLEEAKKLFTSRKMSLANISKG